MEFQCIFLIYKQIVSNFLHKRNIALHKIIRIY